MIAMKKAREEGLFMFSISNRDKYGSVAKDLPRIVY
ncbi:hypothetical protein XM71_c20384 [Vibrio parahaemolyticus]|nr:hypothetical protein XM71_c20384 [Vibrio parahaemolyticus]